MVKKTILLITIILLITPIITNAELLKLPTFNPKIKNTQNYLYYEIDNWQGTNYFGYDKNKAGSLLMADKTGIIGEILFVPAFKHPTTNDWYLCPIINPENHEFYIENNNLIYETNGQHTCYLYSDRSQTINIPLTTKNELTINQERKIKITNNITLNLGITPSDTGFTYYITPTDQTGLRYIKNNEELIDLTQPETAIPIIKKLVFYNSDLKKIGQAFDWTDLLDNGQYYSEIITIGGLHGLLIGTYGYGASNNIYVDPLFVVDYSPAPALRLENGTNNETTDNNYQTQEDVTTYLSDDDIYTARTTRSTFEAPIIKDAYVYQAVPTSNYGTSPSLVVGQTSTPNNFNTYLQFNLSEIPSGTVSKATMRLYHYWGTTTVNTTLKLVNETWSETTITWNNKPTTDNNTNNTHELTTAPVNYIDIDVTNIAKEWFNGTTNNGLEMNDINTYAYHYFRAREYSSNPPLLLIDLENQQTSISLSWNKTYNPSFEHFLRLYKLNSAETTITTRAYDATQNVTDTYETKKLTGTGWYNINVSSIMDYETNNESLSITKIRLYSDTELLVSEVRLRIEGNDTEAPLIHSTTTNTTTLSCYEKALITVNTTDNLDVDTVNITINNGTSNNTQALTQTAPLWTTILEPLVEGNITYELNNVESCDILGQCNNTNPSITINYFCDICVENWQPQYTNISSCYSNNTILTRKTYVDLNSCGTNDTIPSDNGTITQEYCNYCDPDWEDVGEECQSNNTRFVEYFDNNFCYSQTGLIEDSPPLDNGTSVYCEYYKQQFNCSISDKPYMSAKIHYTCTLNGDYSCVNKISYGFDDVLQVNPQKTERVEGGLINLRTNLESRESFTTQKGLLNAYYTPKNLAADTTFTITTICSDGNKTLTHQASITPSLKELKNTNPALLWIKNNALYLFMTFLLLIALFFLVGVVFRSGQK